MLSFGKWRVHVAEGRVALDDDEKSIAWAKGGGRGTGRRVILSITTVRCRLKREVGCAGNGTFL